LRLQTLKHRSDFDRLRHGRKWVAKGFVLQGAPRMSSLTEVQPRFGFAVGSKALKDSGPQASSRRPGAVIRNRARRRLKEAVRLVAPDHARPDHDYVIIGRRESLHQSFADLLEDLRIAFSKVNRPSRANEGMSAPPAGRSLSDKRIQRHTEPKVSRARAASCSE